ncbi:hypothetical protein PSAC2689_130167 [Paraburkholderia sacchari]
MLKRVCERHHVSWHTLRTASLASLVEWMMRLHENAAPALAAVPVSRFCLRHGQTARDQLLTSFFSASMSGAQAAAARASIPR